WVLNKSDGDSTLLQIAQESGISFEVIASAADALSQADLVIAELHRA
ncbi:MAG: hypothetical protein KY475_22830, partial [Planctomycetes bacterium]|nr:hypothetical protein [Planctomycetota bacterium]